MRIAPGIRRADGIGFGALRNAAAELHGHVLAYPATVIVRISIGRQRDYRQRLVRARSISSSPRPLITALTM
jgi:hypothetical protein